MTEPKPIKSPKRLRRICWYSLAVVVVFVVGLLAYGFWRSEKQHAAIAEIESVGGLVSLIPGGPEWLRRWVGDKRMKGFDRVAVYFGEESEITDEGLRHLSGIADLDTLYLSNQQITDDGVQHLSGLTNSYISLDITHITEKGLLSRGAQNRPPRGA